MAEARSDVPDKLRVQAPEVLVEVYCLQARNLPKPESATGDRSGMYCVVEATNSHQLYKTQTVRSSLHPVWNESYQVKVADSAQQMMTVKIMSERDGRHDDFLGVVVVPVSRIMSVDGRKEGGWYEIRGEKSNVVVGPDGMSKIELSFSGKPADPNLETSVGWLSLRTGGDTWERFFFVLDPFNQMLQYFASPEAVQETSPKSIGQFNTRCCQVDEVEYAEHPNTFKVKTFVGGLHLYADTSEELETWITTLREVGNPPGIRMLPPPPVPNKRSAQSPSPPASSELQKQHAPVQQPSPLSGSAPEGVQRSITSPAGSLTNPLAGNTHQPQSSDSYMQLQRKFEATRRALADHVAKCRDLEDQLQQSKVAQAAMASGTQDSTQLSDEVRRLKELTAKLDKERRQLALDLESARASSSEAATSGQSPSAPSALVVENQSLKDALAQKTAALEASLAKQNGSYQSANERIETMAKTIEKLIADNQSLRERGDEAAKTLPWSVEDQEKISSLSIENSLLKEALNKGREKDTAVEMAKLEGEIKMLKENLEHEQLTVAEANERLKDAHEKEVQAHHQLHELQAFDRDHDYWPQVLKKKDEEIIRLREHVERLSADNRRLIADNQEMKTRFELSRAALSNEVNLQREKASHHEIELKKRIEEVEKRAISAAEGYHGSLQALDTERNELRRELHESQHLLADAKQKCYQFQQEKIQAEAELEGMRKPVKSEQEWRQQVDMLRSQLQNVRTEDASEQKQVKSISSQHAARELIADITSTLNVRSSRILQSSLATSPRPGQNDIANFNAPYSNGSAVDDPYLM